MRTEDVGALNGGDRAGPGRAAAWGAALLAVAGTLGATQVYWKNFVDEADNLGTYGIERVPGKAVEQARVIHQAARNLDAAVQRLEGFKDSQAQLIELRRLEDEGDRLVRDAVAELFNTVQDPIVIIRWKDIHERLEEACDALENAADVLEAILVKNR